MGQNFTTVLLATFTTLEYFESSVKRIFNVFKLENDKIFVFNDQDDSNKKILTYNIVVPEGERADISKVYHTICINRKKASNTLFTINSINKIVEEEIGRRDNAHQIKWENYRNMFITSDKNSGEVVLIKTELDAVLEKEAFFEQLKQDRQPKTNNYNKLY